jgi:hypothetical protein
MTACLLAEIRTGQEYPKEEMMAKLDAHHERMMARVDSELKKMEAMLDVFEERLNIMNTTDLEANQEKSEITVEQQAAYKEEVAVDQYRDWHLAVGLTAEETDPEQWWVLAEVGHYPRMVGPTVPFLHSACDMVIRDQARMMMYAEPVKDGHSRRHTGCGLNATMVQGTET